MFNFSIFLFLLHVVALGNCSKHYTWFCDEYKCVKSKLLPNQTRITPELCELTCHEYSRIWPQPLINFEIKRQLEKIDLEDGYTGSGVNSPKLKAMVDRFFTITSAYNDHNKNTAQLPHKTRIHFTIEDLQLRKLDFDTDESYTLEITSSEARGVEIGISAKTIYGARHGLETLSQVVVYDPEYKVYVVPRELLVEDAPVYQYRGLMIDTGHNYISVPAIKRTLEAMAVNKLNTLHWHMTDSPSFPYVSKSLPKLSEFGALSVKHVYTVQDVEDIVNFAKIRGIRIIPEFDGPAHVGEGFQDTGLVVCFNEQPWGMFCKEPPCGQFDPTQDKLYSTLRLLFRDLIEAFDPVAFHYGGDEVNFNCWRSQKSITKWMTANNMSTTNDSGFIQLWNHYQNATFKIFTEEMKQEIPGILWSNTLTELENLHYLPKDKYIIHVWTNGTDKTIGNLLKEDYRMIFSFYDSYYLDCGFHSWTSDGHNWCAPYSTWKNIYETSPRKVVADFGEELNKPQLIMGAAAALWTETADDPSADNRIWPRTSALAERLWAEPKSTWREAEYRLFSHRERLLKLGINADTVLSQWCYQNQGSCVPPVASRG